jgi:hypothetical protein
MGSFQIGVLTEAFAQAYRTAGTAKLKERMIAMARFVDKYGLDPKYLYTASTFGIVGEKAWHSYASKDTVDYWDPVYTTSLVNTLAWGWHLTGDAALRRRAFYFWQRGNNGIYGEPVKRRGSDASIDHFADSRFASATGLFYLDNNKGELQYVWALFAKTDPAVLSRAGARRASSAIRVSVSRLPLSQRIRLTLAIPAGAGPLRSAAILDWRGRRIAHWPGGISRAAFGKVDLEWEADAPPGVYILRTTTAHGSGADAFFLGP